MSKQDGLTWGELKAWLEQQQIRDDELIGYWDFWWPKSLDDMELWRGTDSSGTGPEAVNVYEH